MLGASVEASTRPACSALVAGETCTAGFAATGVATFAGVAAQAVAAKASSGNRAMRMRIPGRRNADSMLRLSGGMRHVRPAHDFRDLAVHLVACGDVADAGGRCIAC